MIVYGDDLTVRQGSSALVGMRKTRRMEQLAVRSGVPYIDLGETGGARIPDILGAVGITGAQMSPDKGNRKHRVPAVTVIVGKSFGGSSISSARGDFTVQVRGSCLAITSPRVFEVAIGEVIGFEELGGVDVHAERTGQIDLDVDTEDDAWIAVRRWLSYLPSNAWEVAPTLPDPARADRARRSLDAWSETAGERARSRRRSSRGAPRPGQLVRAAAADRDVAAHRVRSDRRLERRADRQRRDASTTAGSTPPAARRRPDC